MGAARRGCGREACVSQAPPPRWCDVDLFVELVVNPRSDRSLRGGARRAEGQRRVWCLGAHFTDVGIEEQRGSLGDGGQRDVGVNERLDRRARSSWMCACVCVCARKCTCVRVVRARACARVRVRGCVRVRVCARACARVCVQANQCACSTAEKAELIDDATQPTEAQRASSGRGGEDGASDGPTEAKSVRRAVVSEPLLLAMPMLGELAA